MIWLCSLQTKVRHHRGTIFLTGWWIWKAKTTIRITLGSLNYLSKMARGTLCHISLNWRNFLNEVCKTFKARTISGKRSPNVSEYYLSSYILKNADVLDMNNFALLIELTFAVSPSTAHVERSFSLREDMLNNSIKVALQQHSIVLKLCCITGLTSTANSKQLCIKKHSTNKQKERYWGKKWMFLQIPKGVLKWFYFSEICDLATAHYSVLKAKGKKGKKEIRGH